MQNFNALPVLSPNQIISGRYRLQQFLGKGAFGQVYAAEDIKFSPPKKVAIKIINPEYINDPVVREDVKREAGVMARFNHPNILRVLDFEVNPNLAYIITDLAEGGSLSSRIQPDPTRPPVQMPLQEVANLLDQIGSALDVAHAQGLVHRDIKPHNILLDNYGRPLLADFGLATTLNGSQKSVMVMANTSGTPPYMAPEQWTGQAGKASDIYAMGILAYQMVTGKTPFQGNQLELMGQHLNTPVPPLSTNAPGLKYPPQLDQVLAEALAKDPHKRIKSGLELARRFRVAIFSDQAAPKLAATEVVNPADVARVLASQPPAQDNNDPLRAATQVAPNLPPIQNFVNNNQQPVPVQNYNQPPVQNYNQTQYPPQPQNPNYNYNPQVPVYTPPVQYAQPRKNNNAMILIGAGLALVLVLIIVIVVVTNNPSNGGTTTPVANNGQVNNGNTNNNGNNGNNNNANTGGRAVSSRTSLSVYPKSAQVNVSSSYRQGRMSQFNQAFSRPVHDAQYFASPDSQDQIVNYYRNEARSKGTIQGDSDFDDGSHGITFVDGLTGDVVFITIAPAFTAALVGIDTGGNTLIEFID